MTPRIHLGLEFGRLRMRMLHFLEDATARGWLPAASRTDAQAWPDLDEVRRALLHGLPNVEASTEAAVAAQARAIEDFLAQPGADRLPIPQLASGFELSRSAVDTLLLAAGCATDPALRTAIQLWQRDPRAIAPDAELAGLLFGGRLDPTGALVQHALIVAEERPGRTLFWVPSAVLAFLAGEPACSLEVAAFARFEPAPPASQGGGPEVPGRLLTLAGDPSPAHPHAHFLLGREGSGRRTLARAAAAAVGRPSLTLDVRDLSSLPTRPALRALRRDALLTGAILVLHVPDAPTPGAAPDAPAVQADRPVYDFFAAMEEELATDPALVLVTGPVGLELFARSRVLSGERVVGLPPERAARLVREMLAQSGEQIDGLPEALAKLGLGEEALVAAVRRARLSAEIGASGPQDAEGAKGAEHFPFAEGSLRSRKRPQFPV